MISTDDADVAQRAALGEPIRLLLIEDNPGDADLIALSLRRAPTERFELTHAELLSEGVQLLAAGAYDLVLLDLSLPDSWGLDSLTRIQAAAPHTPIMILSAYSDERTAVTAVQQGAQDYLVKGSFDYSSLIRSIRYSIERKRNQEEIIELNSALEQRVAERTRQLSATNRDLVTEIAARHEVEQALRVSEQRLQTVMTNAPLVLFALDADGRLTLIEGKGTSAFGGDPGVVLGRSIFDLYRERPDLLNHAHRALRGEEFTATVAIGPFMYEISYTPMRTECDAVAGVVGVATDVTERRRAAEEHQARELAETTSAAKSRFLSRMSHELRTPLNAILGFTQLLQMDDLDAEQHESLELIFSSGQHLLALIDYVLKITELEEGGLVLVIEPVPLYELLQESIAVTHPAAEQGQITVQLAVALPDGQHVLADHTGLWQILVHFLSNAIKYHRAEGAITITCEERPSQKVRISVQDTGIGIAPENIGYLFTPFERLDAEAKGIAGTGLGLAYAKLLVEAMAGTIGVVSTPNVGSTFWIELPLADRLPDFLSPAGAAIPELA